MKRIKLITAMTLILTGSVASAECITDNGSYEDNYGYAALWFKNTCDHSVTVNVCVKSYPPGSNDAKFNLYSGTAYANSTLTLTDGKWSAFDSYRWNEDASVSCPF